MIVLVWAQARNGVIGKDNRIPWHLPEDLAHFRRVTSGHPVIMGRKTWDSLPEAFRPLPGRDNLVVTRQEEWSADGAIRAASLDDALRLAGNEAQKVFVIGGGQLYAEAVLIADTAIITTVDLRPEGDAFAPSLGRGWVATHALPALEIGWLTAANGLRYRMDTWRRR